MQTTQDMPVQSPVAPADLKSAPPPRGKALRELVRAFYRDKRNVRPKEVIGGGYIVARRGRGSGRFRMHEWPFEHATAEAAHEEATRLAAKHPGKTFVVLQQTPISVSIPTPAAALEASAEAAPERLHA